MADRFTITFEVEPLQEMWMNKLYKKSALKFMETHCGGPWGSELQDSALELVETWYDSKNGSGHGPGRAMGITIRPLSQMGGPRGPGGMHRPFPGEFETFASEQILFYEFVLKPAFRKRKIKAIEYTCGGKEVARCGGRGPKMLCGVMIRSYDDHDKIVECLRDLASERKIVTWENAG